MKVIREQNEKLEEELQDVKQMLVALAPQKELQDVKQMLVAPAPQKHLQSQSLNQISI